MLRHGILKDTLWNHLFRGTAVALIAIGTLFVGATAYAACGDPGGAKLGVALKLPFLTQSNAEPKTTSDAGSIVGLWHVTFETGGQFFYESFEEWHSDGTELENPNLPPIGGSVCVGAWKRTPDGIVHLNHIGWNFDLNGNSTGTFTITERNTVSPGGNSYRGVFDYKVYDVDGNLLQEITGTQTAKRITAY